MQHSNITELKGVPLDQVQEPFAPLDMGIFDGNRSSPPELPLRPFREWGDWITAAAEKCGSPPDYPAIGLLAVASTLIGNARWVSPWDGWKEPPVLWLAAVGDPSSGKSPGLDIAFDFLNRFEAEMCEGFDEVVSEYERAKEIAVAAHDEWKSEIKSATKSGGQHPPKPDAAFEPETPVRPRLSVSDTTTEALGGLIAAHPKGLLCKRDELAAWLGDIGKYSNGSGGERAFFIEAYGGRPHTVDRVKNPRPIKIKRLTLGVIGGIQPERLAEVSKGADDGLLARTLMSWPNPVPPKRPTGPPIPLMYQDALRRLKNLEMIQDDEGDPAPRIMRLAEDAADLLDEWRKENSLAERDTYGLMKSHNGKLPGIVIRLAITLEYLEWCLSSGPEPDAISKASVGFAIYLVNSYFQKMAARVYGEAALPPAEKGATMLARRIRREKALTVNTGDIRRIWKLQGLRLAEALAETITVLVECGVLSWTGGKHKDGRKKLDYSVNPEIYGGDHG